MCIWLNMNTTKKTHAGLKKTVLPNRGGGGGQGRCHSSRRRRRAIPPPPSPFGARQHQWRRQRGGAVSAAVPVAADGVDNLKLT